MLKGKTIVLGVCGGIAAYKAAELVRLYIKAGAEVHVIMTSSAREFVTPLTFQALTGQPVHTELFNLYQEREIGHISLADRADLFVVAPATANLIGKMASGIADDMLSTTIMATRAPVLLAPAMNSNMWDNTLVQENLERLKRHGIRVMEPDTGFLACGWEGKGKLPDPAEICLETEALLRPSDLQGRQVLITAGGTREAIDPVRYIGNASSGKMGYALARAARQRGAEVVLISAPTALPVPRGVRRVEVTSAAQMFEAVMNHQASAHILIKAAAVADFRPLVAAGEKIKKRSGATKEIRLEATTDILRELGALKGDRILVGFAAETNDLLAHALTKLEEKNLDLIVANDVTAPGAGFDVETNRVLLIGRDGSAEELPCLPKLDVAHSIFDCIAGLRTGR